MSRVDESTAVYKIQEWYSSNCDGDWEHQSIISLKTLDNPGWSITINLEETVQESQKFEEIKINYDDETTWMVIKKEDNKLLGACGPNELGKMLSIIATWLKPAK
ncbi:hypothetical protein IWQ48_003818 [Labrenzia sp. EL_13]|nr:hypothetical protein [Labrenzia sp. EL_13]